MASTRIAFCKKTIQSVIKDQFPNIPQPEAVFINALKMLLATQPLNAFYAARLLKQAKNPGFDLLCELNTYFKKRVGNDGKLTDFDALVIAYFYYYAIYHQINDSQFKQHYPALHTFVCQPLQKYNINQTKKHIHQLLRELISLPHQVAMASAQFQYISIPHDMIPTVVDTVSRTLVHYDHQKHLYCYFPLLFNLQKAYWPCDGTSNKILASNLPLSLKLPLTTEQRRYLGTQILQAMDFTNEHLQAIIHGLFLLVPESDWPALTQIFLDNAQYRDYKFLLPSKFHTTTDTALYDKVMAQIFRGLRGENLSEYDYNQRYQIEKHCINALIENHEYIPERYHQKIFEELLLLYSVNNRKKIIENIHLFVKNETSLRFIKEMIIDRIRQTATPVAFELLKNLMDKLSGSTKIQTTLQTYMIVFPQWKLTPIKLLAQMQIPAEIRQDLFNLILDRFGRTALKLVEDIYHFYLPSLNRLCKTEVDWRELLHELLPHLKHEDDAVKLYTIKILQHLDFPVAMHAKVAAAIAPLLAEERLPSARLVLLRHYANSGMQTEINQLINKHAMEKDPDLADTAFWNLVLKLPDFKFEAETVFYLYEHASTSFDFRVLVPLTPPCMHAYLLKGMIEALRGPFAWYCGEALIMLPLPAHQAARVITILCNNDSFSDFTQVESMLIEKAMRSLNYAARSAAIALLESNIENMTDCNTRPYLCEMLKKFITELKTKYLEFPITFTSTLQAATEVPELPTEVSNHILSFR